MTDQTTIEEKKQPKSKAKSRAANIGIFLSLLAIIAFILTFAYGYFQLANINVALAQMVSDFKTRIASTQQSLSTLQTTVAVVQQTAEKSAALGAQQEQIMKEWHAAQQGDLNKWHVAEAHYLINLANDHLQFTYNIPLALALLKRADQILEHLQDPSLLAIRQALVADIANLQNTPQVDTTSLYLQLSGLNKQLDQLPLPINPLPPDVAPPTTTAVQALPWWREGLHRTWRALSKVVIVRNTDRTALPLVMPDEKIFLYQNLHAQMEGAMWGLLHRNADIYQESLARAMAWIQKYFRQEAPKTKNMLQQLEDLRKVNIQPPALNLGGTLKLIDSAAAIPTTAQ